MSILGKSLLHIAKTQIENLLKMKSSPKKTLGNSRLRTETAAIVACHTVALAHEF